MINLEKPIVGSYKDRFIIRSYSPVFTIGGGEIILTSNKKNNFIDDESMKLIEISKLVDNFHSIKDDNYLEILIESNYKNPIFLENFCYKIGYSETQLLELLKSNNNIIIINQLNIK